MLVSDVYLVGKSANTNESGSCEHFFQQTQQVDARIKNAGTAVATRSATTTITFATITRTGFEGMLVSDAHLEGKSAHTSESGSCKHFFQQTQQIDA